MTTTNPTPARTGFTEGTDYTVLYRAPQCEYETRTGVDDYERCGAPATTTRTVDHGPDGDMENGPSRDYEPPTTIHLCDTHAAEHDAEVFDMTHARCPECAIAAGATRQRAFDLHYGPWQQNTNPQREIVRTFSSGGADPTTLTRLACGHTTGF